MSYEAKLEVRDGNLWESYDSDDVDMNMGPVARHVAFALDVLRASWGPDAVVIEYRRTGEDGSPMRVAARKHADEKRTVARSPWRKVDGADDE